MRKLVTILLVGASLLLSSCEYDSVGLSYTSTSYPHYRQPAPAVYYRQPAVYRPGYRHSDGHVLGTPACHTYYAPPSDWMRYGGNWTPTRRHHPHH